MMTKEEANKKIEKLVKRFAEQIDSYKESDYNETLTRRDFIDPFFKALGWDIDNEQGFAEAYREVIHEDKIKIGGATKAPDYSFRLGGGKRLFFVEAKKPSVDVKEEILPAYQVRRYGWSAKLAISIITDFEEFAVYDCTKKPDPTDKASVARIKYILFKDYLKEFDFIWDTFSKEKVLTGSFDKFVQSDTYKKGTATVDKEFLQSLDNWRTYLATSISWNNKELGEDEINFAVQQTIDRIIFLRIAEDRGLEPYGILKHNLKQGDYYQNLFDQFRKADEKYNSGLFDLKKDQISKHLKIENKIIKTIIDELYYPECPYEFSVLSVEILGSAYEQFLGKVIRITPAHHAKIEEKPEVRKAGGVYYTPQYIVEYIVKNTIEKLIHGKSPKEISKIKIVDPACGSGSFLLGAYQHLLDYHKNYYTEKGKISKGNKNSLLTPEGNLTTNEKKRILLNNIFGVDIDVNAVEVTKLSLLLKCMEGETEASIATQMKLFHERILPTLDNNIKDGNSLVDTDFYSGELDFGFDKKIKPFNWQKAFPEVFKKETKDIFHVVFTIKNSRYDHIKIQRRKEPGFIAPTYPFIDGKEEEMLVGELCKTVKELDLEIMVLNFCGDHVHAILAVEDGKLSDIMRLWKGKTAFCYNRRINPSVDEQAAIKSDGTKQELWAKSFFKKKIEDQDQLKNTIGYIKNNRIKHGLMPLSDKINEMIDNLVSQNIYRWDTNRRAADPWVTHRRVNPSVEDSSVENLSVDEQTGINSFDSDRRVNLSVDKQATVNRRVNPSVKNPSVYNIYGGFDVVIGNPPYVRSQHIDEVIKSYLINKYSSSSSYQPDLFAFFIDKGIRLLKQDGLLGFIIPNGILTNNYYSKSRNNILNTTSIKIIVDLKDRVFESASVDTSIFILEKESNEKTRNKNKIFIGEYPAKIRQAVETPQSCIVQSEFLKIKDFVFNTSSSSEDFKLVKKISLDTTRLGHLCVIKNGMKVRKELVATKKIDKRYKPFLLGASVKPYLIEYKSKWVCYDKTLESKFTNQAFREEEIFIASPKIIVRQVMDQERIFATLDKNSFYVDQSVYVLLPKDETANLKFIVALLNSKLLHYYFSKTSSDRKETFPKIKGVQLAEFPIKYDTKYLEIIQLVDQLLKLNQEKTTTKLQTKLSQLQSKIDYCEDKINEIVYRLYGLTEEEIKIIES